MALWHHAIMGERTDTFRLRTAKTADAGAFLKLLSRLDRESDYLVHDPEERRTSQAEAAMVIAEAAVMPNSVLFLAEDGEGLAGYALLIGGDTVRTRHSARLAGFGVIQSRRRLGLGENLMRKLELWALRAGVERIELKVMVANQPALHLYEKLGYEVEGRLRDAYRLAGVPMDALVMAKLLPPKPRG